MKKTAVAIIGFMLLGFMCCVGAQEAKPYKDGPVTIVSFVKTKPGKFDEYMEWMATTGKTVREAQKKAGILLSYGVFAASPRSPGDADIILTMTYPNMAAFDRTDDFDAVALKTMGATAVRNKATAEREALREVLGTQMIREMILK